MLNWSEFERLPGSAQNNFEGLCRNVIRLHYGQYGQFRALANQPGVEFHLKLHTTCTLGEGRRWFGWQCRWYDLPNGRPVGTTRRKQIEDALHTTERYLTGLTDWILWTRQVLTQADQEWFYGLTTKMRLELRSSADVEDLLNGEAEILRSTYFGELVLTPNTLQTLHQTSVARVRSRWVPELHQVVEAERTVRQMLGETESWDELKNIAGRLNVAATAIEGEISKLTAPFGDRVPRFVDVVRNVATVLQHVYQLLDRGDLDALRQELENAPAAPAREIIAFPRHLRAARLDIALIATNALADLSLAREVWAELQRSLNTRIVGVLADAGGGKTHIAAQLTAPTDDRPAGVLLYGQDLHAGDDLNTLSKRIVIPGTTDPIPSAEALVAAVDAAGQRARRRLPILIDGLNEAEDPRDWKGPFASLDAVLRRYPYVLLVCTVRTGSRSPMAQRGPSFLHVKDTPDRTAFADEALPENVERLEIPDFGEDTSEAIERYFSHYKINPGDADVPFELLRHPLTLRLFCEVTNPAREKEVGIEAMPGSLTALFDEYLKQAARRIAELAPRPHRYYQQDVSRAFDQIGTALWEYRARAIDVNELRKILSDEARSWNDSIIRALEQEGVILRMPGRTSGHLEAMVIYDALAGHLVADSLLMRFGRTGFENWLKEPSTVASLAGTYAEKHPLASDILRAFAGLVPRRLHRQQLWPLLEEPLRTVALRRAANLEAEYLDNETVVELAKLAASHSGNLFPRLYRTRGSVRHPLNANFLDHVLRPMAVWQRDLVWTEWVRRNREALSSDLIELQKNWKSPTNASSDHLRAQWVMWTLTSSVRELRDQATRTLYWFGRSHPKPLFQLVQSSLNINDRYVPERMLAAAYGVAMARYEEFADEEFVRDILPEWARELYQAMFAPGARHATTHILQRDYARRIIELGLIHNSRLLSKTEKARIRAPYTDSASIEWPEESIDKVPYAANSPFEMDFANYTLGRLVEDRANYDFDHPGYRKVAGQMLWRIHQLGWSSDSFNEVDRGIATERTSWNRIHDVAKKVDRYGKKYSWIAFFEMAGLLRDKGKLTKRHDRERISDADIDPSFPDRRPHGRLVTDDFLGSARVATALWMSNRRAPSVTKYLRVSRVQNHNGPWVLLDGYFTQQCERRGRRMFCFIRTFTVRRSNATDFLKLLARQSLAGRWLPEKPETYYTYAGEIPWSDMFPHNGTTSFRFVIDEKVVPVRRKREWVFLDGEPLPLETLRWLGNRMFGSPRVNEGEAVLSAEQIERLEQGTLTVEEKETRQKTRNFQTQIPVLDWYWESYHSSLNTASHATVVAKEIAYKLRLAGQPQTFDLSDKTGERATVTFSDHEADWNNTQAFLFMKEPLLRHYLNASQRVLIWAVWGEREYSNAVIQEILEDKKTRPNKTYEPFQSVRKFT